MPPPTPPLDYSEGDVAGEEDFSGQLYRTAEREIRKSCNPERAMASRRDSPPKRETGQFRGVCASSARQTTKTTERAGGLAPI